MKLVLAVCLFSITFSNAFAIDIGDGSDGACTNATFVVGKRNYQCTSLTINAALNIFRAVGGAAVVIKVQNDATITGSIDISGADGIEGDSNAPVGKTGGFAGAGGSAGGSSPGTKANGAAANATGGASGARGGGGGDYVPPTSINGAYGGGGGGGSFKTQGAVSSTQGEDVGGTGSVPGSEGASGVALGDEATFDSSFTGGAGGGAGGDGEDSTAVTFGGSSGGGGGGAIRIVAGGDITVNTTIIADGGNGGGLISTQFAGGGGAGSGGAIFIQAAGNLTVVPGSTLRAVGGSEGLNDIGSGGSGGLGIIRLDDGDGVVSVAGSTVTQGKYTAAFTPTVLVTGTSTVSRSYASDVSCASVALDDHNKPFNNVVNLILGMAMAYLIHFLLSKKSKV